jgi:hypothetical protein
MTTNNSNFKVVNGVGVALNASIAGTLTASTIVGNATSSTQWANPMTLTHTGDVTGVGTFNGSVATTIAVTLASSGVTVGTYNSYTVNSKGLITSGSVVSSSSDATGEFKTSIVDLTSSGYLPLSSSTISNTYNAGSYPALASLCGITYGVPTGSQMTLPVSAQWLAVAWGGSLFVAVAGSPSTYAASSPDGINWLQITLPVGAYWYSVCWGGSLFVAVAWNSTYAASSPDGITWTQRILPASTSWYSVAWGGSLFVAVASSSTYAASSPDGINWTARSLPVSTAWHSVCWGGSLFVAVANSSTYAASSPDGINWTARSLPVSTAWYSIASNGTIFAAVAYNSTIAATITTFPSQFTTPTFTGSTGIAKSNYYIKT